MFENILLRFLLSFFALTINIRKSVRERLLNSSGWIDFTIAMVSKKGEIAQAMSFNNGKAKASPKLIPDADATIVFRDRSQLKQPPRLEYEPKSGAVSGRLFPVSSLIHSSTL